MFRKSIVIITCIICILSELHGQEAKLKFHHIGDEQGLSNSTIESIFQDSRGFMWFGTRDGLNRYDGHQMVVYKNNDKDINSISDNFIFCITEDHLHNLWIGTKNGLNRLDVKNDKFTRYNYDAGVKNSLSDNQVSSIHEDKDHHLWVGTYSGGLNLFDQQTNKFTHFKHNESDKSSIGSDFVTNMCEDSDGRLWIATRSGINLYNKSTHAFSVFQNLSDVKDIGINNNIIKILAGTDGLWLGTVEGGLFHFDPVRKIFKAYKHDDQIPYSLSSDMVKSMYIDQTGRLWVGSINGGLDLFNAPSDSFIHNQNTPGDRTSLSQKTASAILEDNQGNLWIGTHRGGLNLYIPGANKFTLYRQDARPNSLGYYDITAFFQDQKGRLWVGTDHGGLDLFNQASGTFKHYRYDRYNNKSLSSDAVLNIMEDNKQRMWVSTWDGGLNLFDVNQETFVRLLKRSGDKSSISSNHVQKTFQDSRGHIWVATYFGGLNLLDPDKLSFRRIISDPSDKTKLFGDNIVALNEDKDHNLWIGTDDGGLNCYNLITEHFTHYFYNPGKKPDIRIIFIDSKGRVWVGQNGLYLFDKRKNNFYPYTTVAGLSTEFIKGILEDANQNLWISTSNGLTKLNPQNMAFKKFNMEDGLQGLEFEANAALKTKEGEMFFGGVNGFNCFYPDRIKYNKFIPPVYLTDFQLFNKSQLPGQKESPLKQDISSTNEIVLNYRQSTFAFTFAALNYTAPLNNKYAYKLEGFDNNWINAGNEQKASYTNLDVGNYVFRVKASNNDGLWNEKGAVVKIVILPPFWGTIWFRVLFGLFAAAIIYSLYASKRNRTLKKLEETKKEEMHQVQLQFFTNISHEFRTPLTLIIGLLERFKSDETKNISSYFRTIERNANRLMNLINELMDFNKMASGALKLRVRRANIIDFVQNIVEDFRHIAPNKTFTLTISEVKELNDVWVDIKIIEKIILNLLNNAFKYSGENAVITVEVFTSQKMTDAKFENELIIKYERRAPSYFFIKVTDNGIGIPKDAIAHLFERYFRVNSSQLGSGVGLSFVKNLTLLHKGDIYVNSEVKMGTQITVAFPLGIDSYSKEEIYQEGVNEHMVDFESFGLTASLYNETDDTEIPGAENEGQLSDDWILLVDDNDELRDFYKKSLMGSYQIHEAANGEEGLRIAKKEAPVLIISDVMMPVMDGNAFCQIIKNDLETSHIPFIMLTAKYGQEAQIEGVESGADIYLSKPVSIKLLQLTIRNILEQKRKLKEFYVRDYYSEAKDLANNTKDKEFLEKLVRIIDTHIINPDLDLDFICQEIGMSHTKLYNKVKSITSQSVIEFIRSFRLKKAIQIMTHEDVSMNEVTYRVGIQTQSHFSKAFKKEFGKTPSQFLQEIQKPVH